jgi:hypothetical protein
MLSYAAFTDSFQIQIQPTRTESSKGTLAEVLNIQDIPYQHHESRAKYKSSKYLPPKRPNGLNFVVGHIVRPPHGWMYKVTKRCGARKTDAGQFEQRKQATIAPADPTHPELW